MNKLVRLFIGLLMILTTAILALCQEDIIIESRLFKGIKNQRQAAAEVVVSSLSEPFIVPVRAADIEQEKRSVASMKRELRDLYHLREVDHMVSANMIWDGKKDNLVKTILLEDALFPIRFDPHIVSEKDVNLRVRVSQLTAEDLKIKASRMALDKKSKTMILSSPLELSASQSEFKQLLDTEITIPFNQSVVLGFPVEGNSYFLEIFINNKKEARNIRSFKDKYRGYPEIVKTEMEFFSPPNPIREVPPVYPENCKEKNIEGTVILQVKTDIEGKVTEVEVLKGAHKDLDRAAVAAIEQWRYEPVKKDGIPIPVYFTVTVDFKLHREEIKENNGFLSEENHSLDELDLNGILSKCADYCDGLSGSALFFVCQERIMEEIFGLPYGREIQVVATTTSRSSGGESRAPDSMRTTTNYSYRAKGTGQKVERNVYVYDYQLVKEGSKMKESRTLLEENGEKKNEKGALLQTKRFLSERAVFGPVGLLSRSWQEDYDYRLLRERSVDGRKAYVIEAKPKTIIEGKPNYGKIWIDQENFSVLKLEIAMESLSGFELVKEEFEKLKIKPDLTVVHHYGYEKNGLRFPSKTTFKEDYISSRHRRMTKSKANILYSDYRFFTVETDVKYKPEGGIQ